MSDPFKFVMCKGTKIKLALTYSVCLPICFACAGIWHELVGHGLVGLLAGGYITELHLFGIRVFPEFGWSGVFGSIGIENIKTPTLFEVTAIAGPLSTWCVSVLATILLWMRHWKGLYKVVLVCLSLQWYDIFSETLTVWGIPKFIFFYSRPPVHYEAAVRLGLPGSLFHVFSIGTSICLLVGLVICLIRDHKRQVRFISHFETER